MDRNEDRTQNVRAGLLVAGAVTGAVGMAQENSVIIYIALGILFVGGVLAIIRRAQIRKSES